MEANKSKLNKLVFDQWIKVTIFSLISLLLVISLILISRSMSKSPSVDDIDYSYTRDNDVNYKVYYYDNSFYESNYLEMNKTYASLLIQNIETTFTYNYSNSILNPLQYTYNVTATIVGNYGDSSNDSVWKKSYTLLEPTVVNLDSSNSVNISQIINIDYRAYYDEVEAYKKQLGLAISAYLEVVMTVEVENGNFTDSDQIIMNIPITDTTTNIETTYDDDISKTVFKNDVDFYKTDYLILSIGSLGLIICVIGYIILFRKLFNSTKKSEYKIKLNKILKNYGEVIVEITNEIEIDNLKLFEISKIEDMIDLEEELRIPIMYYEKREDTEGWFVIKKDDLIYRYVLGDRGIVEIIEPILKENKKKKTISKRKTNIKKDDAIKSQKKNNNKKSK